VSKLLIAIFADLEFSECDEVEIKYNIIFFMLNEFSEKICNLRKIIRPSGCLQYFIIKALDAEAVS
jgi:hypothetical protein